MFRILIVDDSADTVELLQVVLQHDGYETRSVNTREAASIAVANEFQPHAILLDYIMTGIPLQEFVAAIRKLNPSTQFVIISGLLGEAGNVARELDIPLLPKPFEPKALYEILERITGSGEYAAVEVPNLTN